ncbi:MAG TPA: glycosyltransferase [Beijerinckiaceae bacterium]|jgi:pyruvyltransferase
MPLRQDGSARDLTPAPLRAAYFQRVRNIGDAIAPYVLEDVADRRAFVARSAELPYLLSIGSLLSTSTSRSYVWGTGLIHPGAGLGSPDPARILAVRGKLTHAELRRGGVAVADVPLGDPGFLVPRLLDGVPRSAPRFPLGLVPHYVDRGHPFFAEAAKDAGVKVLNVCDPPEIFFRELVACAAVASTSLHGLIFGEALGLPTLWLEVSGKIHGEGFKFADWFSLAGNPQPSPFRPAAFSSGQEIVARCEPREIAIDATALAQAVTPEVVDECSRSFDPGATFVPVSTCRARPLPVFIISLNCAADLEQVISACRRQRRAVEIVVYDDGSDEPETLVLLERLRQLRLRVYRRGPLSPPDRLARLNDAIQDFFRDWCEPSRYVVGEAILGSWADDPAALETYDDLLDRCPPADSVGPLSRSDSLEGDTLFEVVAKTETDWAGGGAGPGFPKLCRCVYIGKAFDGSFALYRSGLLPKDPMKALRVAESIAVGDAFPPYRQPGNLEPGVPS